MPLTPCVKSLHIWRRICLCKSQSLCFFEGVIKIPAFLGHFGQNIVGRTVDNSHYLSNLIACQTLFQGAVMGIPPPTAASKTKIAVISLSSLHQFLSVLCQQILVGSHYFCLLPNACKIQVLAGSTPPISSITMLISGS